MLDENEKSIDRKRSLTSNDKKQEITSKQPPIRRSTFNTPQDLPETVSSVQQKKSQEFDYGTKIDQNHVNYLLMYHMLTGILMGVRRCEERQSKLLDRNDYKAAHKLALDV